MRNSSQLIPSGVANAARVPAYGLPVVREVPLTLEPTGPDTFGGLTGAQSPTSPRRGHA